VRIFLLADAVTCALTGQPTPDGYYNLLVGLLANALLGCCRCSRSAAASAVCVDIERIGSPPERALPRRS
jgi:hypothetical protein